MLEVKLGGITHTDADTLVVYLMEGGPGDHPANATNAVDVLLGGALRRAVAAGAFTGRQGEVWTAQSQKLIIVVGLGAAETFDEHVAAEAVTLGLKKAAGLEARHIATVTLGTGREGLSVKVSATAVAEGVRWAGGAVPVELLVYDVENLEAARAASVIGSED